MKPWNCKTFTSSFRCLSLPSELDISNVDISHVTLSPSLLIIKNEICSFEIRNVPFSNTKNLAISNTKNVSITNTKIVLISNTKSVAIANTKKFPFQIRKSGIFKKEKCAIFKYEKCVFFKYENIFISNAKMCLFQMRKTYCVLYYFQIRMLLIFSKRYAILGRACNNYCRINELKYIIATNSFMLLKQSSTKKWTEKNCRYTFLTRSYWQIFVMWKLLNDFCECNPWNLINNGNG